MSKTAIITGAGQDASHLAEHLLDLDYKIVLFTKRRSVGATYLNIVHLLSHPNFTFLNGDISDPTFVAHILKTWQPDEYYNLAAQSHVQYSFADPVQTFRVNAESVLLALSLIRTLSPHTKFYNAGTSEQFGGVNCPETGYTLKDNFHPRSPYGVSKVAAYHAVVNYREAYGLFACNGLCFNHSGPRRGVDFATRKITRGVAKVKLGLEKTVKMGNLDAYRDESHAVDVCKAMHLMLQQDIASDYLIASGRTTSIRGMLDYVCRLAELQIEEVYELDERFLRPSDVVYLKGNPSEAMSQLNWAPEYNLESLLTEMYEHDLKDLKHEK